MAKTYILDKAAIAQKITRLAYEIAAQHTTTNELVLAGIAPNGQLLCTMLATALKTIFTRKITTFTVHINKRNPQEVTIDTPQDFTDKSIILIDDVSMTGRTIMYALKPFLLYYPAKIETLVLVERQQKNFPIHSDYVGLHISTTLQELIIVEAENELLTGAYLE